MQQGLDASDTVLRVLKAITERRHPDPNDVEKLRSLDPLLANLPDDELACDVIQRGLQRWKTQHDRESRLETIVLTAVRCNL
jgi:hypothetical protein